jgi:hypothetical protein
MKRDTKKFLKKLLNERLDALYTYADPIFLNNKKWVKQNKKYLQEICKEINILTELLKLKKYL